MNATERTSPRLARWNILAAAAAITLLNAAKPMVIDDAGLYAYARQIATSPGDPYGFDFFWYDAPEPANHVLNPPVVPYWSGLAVALFGDRPAAWKLWLFPFHVLLAGALHGLLRRLAPGLAAPLLWMVLLSPCLVTGINLAFDVPALALGLTALALFMGACDRDDGKGALLAGLVAGIALQTKYTALAPFLALTVYGLLTRRARWVLLAGVSTSAVFVAWEVFVAFRYGESHFLYALLQQEHAKDPVKPPLLWALGFLMILGPTTAGACLLGLLGLGARGRLVAVLAVGFVAALGAIPFLPSDDVAGLAGNLPRFGDPHPEQVLHLAVGLAVAVFFFLAAKRLGSETPSPEEARLDRFLLAWMAIEIAGTFLLSPFLASRRIVGLNVVLFLVAGRLVSRLPVPGRAGRVWLIAVWGFVQGLLFYASDLTDARARRTAFGTTARVLGEAGADWTKESIWFIGHWEFQYYAERAGWRPIVAGESFLRRGDWLVVPTGVPRQAFLLPPDSAVMVDQFSVGSSWPWSTLPSFYAGPLPIRRQPQAQLGVLVVQMERDLWAQAPVP